MANYTYTIGGDKKPITVNVKPGDNNYNSKSLEVYGEQFAGQVFVDRDSEVFSSDVYVKAKVLADNADGLEEYTYKKTVVDSQRITIKEINRVVVTTSDTAETEGDYVGQFEKTTVTWTLNEQGVLTEGAPVVEYVEDAGSGEAVTTSTFKKFTATYNGTSWVDDAGVEVSATADSVTYTTTTKVYTYDNGYSSNPDEDATVVEGLVDPVLPSTTYQQYTNGSATGTDITSEVNAATQDAPYAYALNNIVGEQIIFVIKNPTNIDSEIIAGTEYKTVNPAEVSLTVYDDELNVNDYLGNILALDFNPHASATQYGTVFAGSANNDVATSTTLDDTFTLGEGQNTINFDTKKTEFVNNQPVVKGFGNDVVEMTLGEKLNLNFVNGGEIVAVRDGDDVVFSTVQYYATATVYGGTGWCTDTNGFGVDAANGTEYRFELAEYNDTSDLHNDDYNGKILWRATQSYNYGTSQRYVSLEAADFLAYDATTGTCSSLDNVNAANPQIVNMKVFKVVNGVATDITEQYYNDVKAADTNSYDLDGVTSDLYDGQRVAGTVTVKDLWTTNVPGEGFEAGQNVGLTVNGEDWVTYAAEFDQDKNRFVVTPDKDNNYVGTYKNEYVLSTVNDESFDLGKGSDKVEFKGNFGNDTIKPNKSGILDLVIKDQGGEEISIPYANEQNSVLVATTSGNDVVLSAKVQYYATATVYGGTGWCTDANGFGTDALHGTEYRFELAPYHDTQFHDDNYDGKILWRATEGYNYGNDTRYVSLEAADFNYDATTGTCSSLDNVNAANPQIVNMKVFKVVNGVETDITQNYAADAGTDGDNATSDLYNSQVNGSITIEGLAEKSTNSVIFINGMHTPSLFNFTPTPDDTGALIGSRFNERVNSTSADETFDLKTGNDLVNLNGTYGDDTVKLTKGEKFQMFIHNNGGNVVEDYATEMKGKDLVVTSKISYYAKATVYGGTGWCTDTNGFGVDAANGKEYRFELAGYHDTQFHDANYDGKILWRATEGYNYGNDTRYVSLEAADFANYSAQSGCSSTSDNATDPQVVNIRVYKVVNGVETEITQDYSTNALADGDSATRDLFNTQVDGSVTVKDFKDKGSDTTFFINNTEFKNELVSKKNVFTGSSADEVAYSTSANETFDLKTGKDKIVFRGNIGNDTVKITNGEVLDLDFGEDVVFETKGNDVIASIDVSYYATATVTGTAYGNNFGAGTDDSPATEYTFALRGSHLSSPEAMAESVNKTDEGDILWYADEPYGKNSDGVNTYLALDITDFGTTHQDKNDPENVNKVTSYHTTFGNANGMANVTNIRIYKVVNGVETEITDTYAHGFSTVDPKDDSCARELYESQVSGTVTLKDFNKSDIDAKVTLNGGLDIRKTDEFADANTYMEQSDFSGGKITTKAQDDIINASAYTSPNGKGLTINSGSGNDVIVGSDYNDKVIVKSLAGDKTTTTELSGTNKITTGKGDDTVYIGNPLAGGPNVQITNNTVNLGSGNNKVIVDANGKNKITGGSGDDTFELNNGFNTVNGKNGDNTFEVTNGSNKLTGGKNVDTFELFGGQNTVKAGKGNDVIETFNGYNTIDLGAGNDTVVANGGYNVIKGSKGNNTYELNGGSNVVTGGSGVDEFIFNADDTFVMGALNAIVNGGKGNDIYDLTNADYSNEINITDTKGKNVVKLAEKDTILFDVTLGKKAKKDKVSNLLTFRNDDGDVTFKGSIAKVLVADDNGDGLADASATEYKLNIKGVAEQVASFMRNELGLGKGASAYDVLAKGGENAENLLAIYNGLGMVGTDGPKYAADIYKA